MSSKKVNFPKQAGPKENGACLKVLEYKKIQNSWKDYLFICYEYVFLFI